VVGTISFKYLYYNFVIIEGCVVVVIDVILCKNIVIAPCTPQNLSTITDFPRPIITTTHVFMTHNFISVVNIKF